MTDRPRDPIAPPLDSIVFGYGPMIPLIGAAVGMRTLPSPWPFLALWLGVVWAAIILVFVAGVRRGFGFGAEHASTRVEIVTMLAYFVPAGMALILGGLGWFAAALIVLLIGYVVMTVLDTIAATHGDAPQHFAYLRPPQMGLAILSLGLMLADVLIA